MSRVEIDETVASGNPLRPVAGASVQVNVRGGAAAVVYTAATGGTVKPNPLTTDAFGRIDGWLEPGAYDLVVSGGSPTISPAYTQPFDAVPGAADAWTPFTFATGWANLGAPYQTVQYRKDQLGDVVMRGTALASAGVTTLIGTLPVGYRPASQLIFPLPQPYRVDVLANGQVVSSGAPAAGWYVAFDGLFFVPA